MSPHQKQPQIIALKVGAKTFELFAIQDKVFDYRKNQQMSLDNVLYTYQIYTDAKAGKEASAKDLKELGDNPIAKILMEGHAQLSTEERRKMVEYKTQEIIGYLHANFCDRDKKPLPFDRIKLAMDQLKGLSIDPNQSAQSQAMDIIKKFEKANLLFLQASGVEATVTVAYQHLSKVQAALKKVYASSDGEQYVDSGVSIKFMVSPAGFDQLLAELERECKGNFDMKVAYQQNSEQPQNVEDSSSKKKAKKQK